MTPPETLRMRKLLMSAIYRLPAVSRSVNVTGRVRGHAPWSGTDGTGDGSDDAAGDFADAEVIDVRDIQIAGGIQIGKRYRPSPRPRPMEWNRRYRRR